MDIYERRYKIGYYFTFVITVFIFFAKLNPLALYPIGSGLDPSWVAALTEASTRGWRFGADIVFTGGPLSSLYTRSFQDGTSYFVILMSVALVLFISGCLSKIVVDVKDVRVAILFVVALTFSTLNFDTAFFAVPLLMVLVVLKRPAEQHWIVQTVGILIGSTLTLAKFSIFPILILSTIILDTSAIYHKRLPGNTIVALIFITLVFYFSGQYVSDLPEFLLSSLQVASGYSEAMSTTGRYLQYMEVATWILCALSLFTIVAKSAYGERYSEALLVTAARIVMLAGFLYVAFKAGFVRHDLHSLIAWGSLAIAAQAYLMIAYNSFRSAAMRALILTGIVGSAFPGYFVSQWASGAFSLPFGPMLASATGQLTLATQLAIEPEVWRKEARDAQARSIEAIREAYPLPTLTGTVDIIPSEQAAVIANGLTYHPRPTVQEYTAYTGALISRDRAFFSGERAPDNLIMAPGSIDNRHPASAEGSLWPLFLTRYTPTRLLPEMVVLQRRKQPLNGFTKPSVMFNAQIDENISVPSGTEPLMIAVDIHQTLIGRFLNFAFKPPQISLVVRYGDNTEATYRLIPAMAREGFLISPLINNAQEYLLLASGRMERMWKRPISIRIDGDRFGIAYDRDIGLTFTPLESSILASGAPDQQLIAEAETEARRRATVTAIIANSPNPGPDVKVIPEGLGAHAPSKLAIPVGPGGKLLLGYGIRDGAWQGGGGTDGVCFAVKSTETTLFERCLDPKDVEADRGRQSATIVVPKETIIFLETSCKQTCTWDWSYWDFDMPELP